MSKQAKPSRCKPAVLVSSWLLTVAVGLGAEERAAVELFSPAQEQQINDLILEAVNDAERPYLLGKSPVAMSHEDVLAQARAQSLSIQAQQHSRAIAEAFLLESRAVYDPVVNLAVAYQRTDTFERSEIINRERGTDLVRDPNAPRVSQQLSPGLQALQEGAQPAEIPPQVEPDTVIPGQPGILDEIVGRFEGRLPPGVVDPASVVQPTRDALTDTLTSEAADDPFGIFNRVRDRILGTPDTIIPGGAIAGEAQPGGAPDRTSANFGSIVCVTVDGVLVNEDQCSLQTAVSAAREFASLETKENKAWEFTWGASQLFSWGGILSAEFASVRRTKNFFPLDDLGLNQALSVSDPIGQDSNFPWTTSFTAVFTTPLPLSKNFGPYGSIQNVNLQLARINDRQADWAFTAVANDVLRDADGAFWELVRNVKQLQIVIYQRQVLEALAERVQRLYDARAITTYDKAQVDANLANIKNAEEIAWNNMVVASNVLVEILDYAEDTIILPTGYSEALMSILNADAETAFDTARRHRPEIKASQLALQSSEIVLKHRRVQTRPDLTFAASVNLNQSDRVLGYDSWGDSLVNVFDPDATDYFVGVALRIPLGNRAVKSAMSQARILRNQALADARLTENVVWQEINSIVATTFSTQSQIEQTKAGLDLAQIAYDKGVEFSEQGLLPEFELLNRLNALLSAKSLYIDALVDHRKTDALLLAAQGVLQEQY